MADISIQKFQFTKDWNNPADFPTYQPDEAQVRADMQELHNQTRDYFNNVLLQAIIEVIAENQEYVQRSVADAILGTVPDNSIELNKLACASEQLSAADTAKLPTSAAVAAYISGKIVGALTADDEEHIPNSKAVADYVSQATVDSNELSEYVRIHAAPVIAYGDTDVTDGSASPYIEGTLYVVLD